MKETINTGKKKYTSLWLTRGKTAEKILLFVSLLLIVILVLVVLIYGRNSFDQYVFKHIAPHITKIRTWIMIRISLLANHFFLVPIVVALIAIFLFKKNKWMAIRTATVLLSSLLQMSLLKRLIQRQRPPDPLVDGITNFSFPSGHAFLAVAFYGLLIWCASVYISTKWLKNAAIGFLILIIAAIGFSRIYLRMHYATDVLAGICMGFVWLDFCLWFIDKQEFRNRAKDLKAGN